MDNSFKRREKKWWRVEQNFIKIHLLPNRINSIKISTGFTQKYFPFSITIYCKESTKRTWLFFRIYFLLFPVPISFS